MIRLRLWDFARKNRDNVPFFSTLNWEYIGFFLIVAINFDLLAEIMVHQISPLPSYLFPYFYNILFREKSQYEDTLEECGIKFYLLEGRLTI